MTGVEYHVLHVQEPILYVIRKVNRQAPDKGRSISNHYIISIYNHVLILINVLDPDRRLKHLSFHILM